MKNVVQLIQALRSRWFRTPDNNQSPSVLDPYDRQDLPFVNAGASLYNEGQTTLPDKVVEAVVLLRKGDVKRAEEQYRELARLEPDNALGYVGLGACRLHFKDYPEAEKLYQQALLLEPTSTIALIGLGSIAYHRAEYQKAIELYQRTLDLKSDVADAHWGKAICYRAVGEHKLAINSFTTFLRLAPSSHLASAAQWYIAELQSAQS